MRYMVLTARHHDGFCLYDSRVSDFTSVQCAAKRDIVEEYVAACRDAGVKVGLYYSLGDWPYRGCWDPIRYPESSAVMVAQAHAQLEELMTQYGKIDLLWYDGAGGWQQAIPPAELWRSAELNAQVRRWQPGIVLNDNAGVTADYATQENRTDAPADAEHPWECCMEMDSISWGNIPYSPNLRTAAQLVVDLVEVAAGAGNLLHPPASRRGGCARKKSSISWPPAPGCSATAPPSTARAAVRCKPAGRWGRRTVMRAGSAAMIRASTISPRSAGWAANS